MVPAEYGLLSIVQVLQRLALSIVAAGLGAAVIRYYHLYEGDQERFQKFFSSSFWFQSFLAVLVAFGILLIPTIGWFGSGVLTSSLLLPLCLIVIFDPPRRLVNQLFTAQQSHRRASSNQLLGFAIATVASVILVGYFGLGAEGRVWGLAIGALTLAFFLMYQGDGRGNLRFQVDVTELKTALAFGLPLASYAFCVSTFGTIDRWLLLEESGPTEVGIYSSYRVVAFGVTFIYAAIIQSWSPRYFQLKEKNKSVLEGQWLIFCILPLLASGFIITYPMVMPILVDESYLVVDDPMIPLTVSALLMGLFTTQTCTLQYLRKTSWLIVVGLAGITGCYLGVKFLVPHYGLNGAATGLVIGYSSMFLVQMGICVWVNREILGNVVLPTISVLLGASVIGIQNIFFENISDVSRIILALFVSLLFLVFWYTGNRLLLRLSAPR